ncbi:hypothetical protein KPL71_014433 [Citrus sinensis]|uniref:Uncharacterized protein n=1 Tax=Citrus sinensis TaxID=2711 RepID=A0ACB8KBL8_CITSI|nr:hypothetical protein KPL71_014433 [Citrus sinensis]
MVDAIVSSLLEQLISVAADEVKQQVRLVTGVREEVKKLTSNLQAIQLVLEDAEKRQMQHGKDASYDMEDVLEEWTTARLKLQIEGLDDDNTLALAAHKKKVCSFFPSTSNCFGSFKQLSLRHDIAVKIREINKTLDDITSQKERFQFAENVGNNVKKPERVRTTSLVDEGEICGRIDEKNELLSKLLGESSEQQKGLRIISLFGLGGIGKTTLAQLAFNNEGVKRKFDIVIWVCVSDAFEEIRIAKAILEVLDKSASSLGEFQSLMQQIQESIRGKKFFLVLDDVWDGDFKKWDPFFSCLKNGHHESKILITTRDRSVALQMGSIDIISVKELGEGECWSLFKQVAFLGRSFEDCEKLEPIGRKIACKCKGLPLAAKVIGNLLRPKRTVNEWQRILDSEMWKVEEIGKERLPETLCELYNLQKLAVRWCTNLRELPAGIGKLMNMRSLMNGQTEKLKYLPIGISRLTSLRTLEKFVVGGGVDGGSTCRLESLKNLQLLRECRVEGLSNVSHVDEAERLQLYNKKNLLRLHLEFGRVVDGEGEEGRRKNEKDKQLLEALQPPLNVEELWILFYGGNIFPKWLTLLTNLRELKLFSCVNCEHLPPLGKSLLEKLTLYNLISVKRVGDEFLGIEESSVDDTSSSSSVIAFPKLKSLKIEDLDELEEWNYRVTRKENISIMPRLSSLEIDCCSKLNVLPDHLLQTTTLQELSIRGCPILEERYRGEDYHMISHIPHIKL